MALLIEFLKSIEFNFLVGGLLLGAAIGRMTYKSDNNVSRETK